MHCDRLGGIWRAQVALPAFFAAIASLTAALGSAIAQTNPAISSPRQEFLQKLSAAAIERTNHPVRYVGAYVPIPYPGGDVPPDTGVCTDEIIRSYRALGIDLQKEVHEDIQRNFAAYPNQGGGVLRTRMPTSITGAFRI